MNHKDLRRDIHPPYTKTVANAAERLALTGFDSAFEACDIGRVVRQADDESLWRLVSVSPVTWHQDNGGGSGSTVPAQHAASHKLGGSDVLSASDIGAEPVIGVKGTAFNKNFGTSAGTVCQGNDARLSSAPAQHAASHKTGGTDALTASDIGAEPAIGAKGSAFNKNFGTAPGTVCQGNDPRLSSAGSGREWLSAPVASSSTTVGNEVFRKVLHEMVAGEVLRFGVTTSSAYATATNSRRTQIGYRSALDVFVSLGQYVVNSASSGRLNDMVLQCVSVNGDGTSNYKFWGAPGVNVPISFTAPSALTVQFNAWVDVSGDLSTIDSITVLQFLR